MCSPEPYGQQHSLACVCVPPVSASTVVLPFPFLCASNLPLLFSYKDSWDGILIIQAHLLISRFSVTAVRTISLNKVTFTTPGLRGDVFGNHIKPSIVHSHTYCIIKKKKTKHSLKGVQSNVFGCYVKTKQKVIRFMLVRVTVTWTGEVSVVMR